MCDEFKLDAPDGSHTLTEGEAVFITLKPTGAYYTIRFTIAVLKYGGLEINGDVLKDNGESNCEGITIQPVDKHTLQVWTI